MSIHFIRTLESSTTGLNFDTSHRTYPLSERIHAGSANPARDLKTNPAFSSEPSTKQKPFCASKLFRCLDAVYLAGTEGCNPKSTQLDDFDAASQEALGRKPFQSVKVIEVLGELLQKDAVQPPTSNAQPDSRGNPTCELVANASEQRK